MRLRTLFLITLLSLFAVAALGQNGSGFVLTANPNPSSPGQTVTLTAGPAPSGTTVTFEDGGPTGACINDFPVDCPAIRSVFTNTGGSVTLLVNTLTTGTHQLIACYPIDFPVMQCSNTVTQVVTFTATSLALSSSANPAALCASVTLTATITPNTATGTVTFFDSTATLATVPVVRGVATFTTSSFSAGLHQILARYNPDPGYGGSSAQLTQSVIGGVTVTLNSAPNPSTFGQPVNITATVAPSACPGTAPPSGNPTGNVTFFDGSGQIGTGAVFNGTATLSISTLAVGTHPLSAQYGGDPNFAPGTSNTVNQVVNTGKTNTTTILTTSANPITFGLPLTLTASVSPSGATGQVQFKDGANVIGTGTLSNGTANMVTSSLTVGTHALTAVYGGDSSFNTSTSNLVNEVVNSPATSSITLSANPNPATLGQTVTLTAVVTPGNAPGSVQFFDGGNSLGQSNVTNGTAILQVSTFTVGNHNLTARYLGDSVNPPSTSNTVVLVVNPPATSSITLSANPNPANVGQTVTLTAVVTPSSASGSVQFFDGGASLGQSNVVNGTATLAVTTFTVGSHSLTARYLGDSVNPASNSNTVVLIVNNTQTSTSLSVTPNPATAGQLVTMTAVVTPSTATGTVTFRDGGASLGTVALSGGVATLSTNGLAVGSHSIVATYNGSSNFNTSTSNAVNVVVNGPTTPTSTTTLTASPTTAPFGTTITLTATVSGVTGNGTPTGSVQFNDGNTNLGIITLNGGTATLTTSTLAVGAHPITASYSGDGTFTPSNSSPPVVVTITKAPTTTTLTASPTSANPGQSVSLTAKVAPGTATGTITFMDGSTSIGSASVSNGGASTSISSLSTGSHSITAVYSGDSNFQSSTSAPVTVSVGLTPTTTSLSASPTSATPGQSVTFTASVAPAGATGSVNFLDGTTSLGSGTLNGGTATLSTSGLAAGSHSITAVYGGDTKFATSTSQPVAVNVRANSTTTLSVSPNPAVVGQTITLRATVAPAAATGSVNFLDGSTSLGSGTLSGGSASITTTLALGNHSLTAAYAGDTNTGPSTSTAVTVVVSTGASLGAIAPTALPSGVIGVAYSQTFTVTGGTAPFTWTLFAGSVPGLSLSSAGVLSGTPTTAGTTSLTVRVVDSAGQATSTVQSLTILPVPSLSISVSQPATTADQPAPTVTLGQAFPVALTATFTLTFTPNASNLPATYTNPDVKFIGGSTTSAPVSIPANSAAPVTLPGIQLGTVAGTITVTLTALTTSTGASVVPTNPPTSTITVPRLAPVIVPGSVKIINITSSGFSVFLDGTTTPRDLATANLTFTAASGTQLNGSQATISLTAASGTWFPDTGANRGVANGGAFSLTLPFTYSGDTSAIGTVSVTLSNSVGTSAAVSGGK